MRKIGITGGIGSGKSIVCDIFSTLGIKVYNADDRAKAIMETNIRVKNELIKAFGERIYGDCGLNRKLLAEMVFQAPDKLETVNAIVHPVVFEDYQQWAAKHNHEIYTIKEAAILFESGANKDLDKTILVYSDTETRIRRVMLRDNVGKEKVLERIQNQMSDDEKLKLSNYVIYNDNNHSLIKQVLLLHQLFIS